MKKILVVEDDFYSAILLKKIFKIHNITPIIQNNGLDSLKYFEENNNNISFVLTDLKLPDIEGTELIKKFKLINNNIPIIVQSAYIHSKQSIFDLGVNDILLKPYNIDQILKIITKYHK